MRTQQWWHVNHPVDTRMDRIQRVINHYYLFNFMTKQGGKPGLPHPARVRGPMARAENWQYLIPSTEFTVGETPGHP